MINILNEKEIETPLISILSKGFSFGYGFFTTIKVFNGITQNWSYHRERLIEHAVFFNLDIDIDSIELSLITTIKNRNLNRTRAKITIFQDIDRVSTLISFSSLEVDSDPVDLTISDYYRGDDPIYKYKSLNYYSNLITPFTLHVDYKGQVLETGIANIFITENSNIYTPPSNLSLLSGTFRNSLLDRNKIGVYSISEAVITLENLKNADSVFITNSIRGIVPVQKIESTHYDVTIPLQLRKLLNENSTKKSKTLF